MAQRLPFPRRPDWEDGILNNQGVYMNPDSIERYREALSKVVCTKCLERTGRGICSIGGSEECVINRYLPEVVSIVETIDSSVMHDYVHELHNVVCVSCRENQDGVCKLRATPGCELDLYFPLIVRTIKELQAQEKG